ncbi:hypothetical protein CANARDRAFT_23357 [[Candida] arabinofermentans NRRL YB-2248]|uniref:Uncharacterized protein n=1 Tax=[Candida] arabinofermentans NRRL YB-2248 TaxID=983967 RepID=A0A1E4T0J9_9ASCO|nr:hypothetical protein CANARDRAFT_23357 [[Candida] arabinofermentans NRRL YB-2248]
MASHDIPDSQDDDPGDLTWEYLEQLQNEKKNQRKIDRQFAILKNLQPLTSEFMSLPRTSVRRTRDHGFYQRHVYTTDLAEYLELATKEQLESQSSKAESDDQILYMLNRKYIKLRKFYEKLNIKRHRFMKKNFALYLEDFKKYQSGGGGTRFYEAIEDTLKSPSDRKQLAKLKNLQLEDVSTTEDETEAEEEQKVLHSQSPHEQIENQEDSSHVVPDSIDDSPPLIVDRRGTSKIQIRTMNILEDSEDDGDDESEANNQIPTITGLQGGDTESESLKEPAPSHTPIQAPFDIFDIPSEASPSPPSSPEVPNIMEANSDQPNPSPAQIEPQLADDHELEFSRYSRRTRRHKFSQDHVYITDTAVHLGLATVSILNDMFDEGQSYEQILNHLEAVYASKRKAREKREAGYGPFYKRNFLAYLEGELPSKVTDEPRKSSHSDRLQNSQLGGFIAPESSHSSDEEYVYRENPDDEQAEMNNSSQASFLANNSHTNRVNSLVDGDFVRNISTVEEDVVESKDELDDAFVFRNRTYKKNKALRGVLPNSFFTLNANKHVTTVAPKRKINESPNKLGIARKKKYIKFSDSSEKKLMQEFLAPDGAVSDGDEGIAPMRFADIDVGDRITSNQEILREGTPELVEIEDDNIMSSAEPSSDDDDINDDAVGIDDYDGFQALMMASMDRNGAAEEDVSAGIDHMLSRGERKSTSSKLPTKVSSNRRPVGSKPRRFNGMSSALVSSRSRGYYTRTGSNHVSRESIYPESDYRHYQTQIDRFGSHEQPIYIDDYDNASTNEPDKANQFNQMFSYVQPNSGRLQGHDAAKSGKRQKGFPTSSSFQKHKQCPTDHMRNHSDVLPDSRKTTRGSAGATANGFFSYAQEESVLQVLPTSHGNMGSAATVDIENEGSVKRSDIQKLIRVPVGNQAKHWVSSPLKDKQFYFRREKIIGTAQLEGSQRQQQQQYHISSKNMGSRTANEVQGSSISHGRYQESGSYQDTVERIGHIAESDAMYSDLDQISLQNIQHLRLKPNSFIHSRIFKQSIDEEGDYHRYEDITFEFMNVRFALGESNLNESSQLTETLMKAIIQAIDKSDLNDNMPILIRQCYIKLLQLCWKLKDFGNQELKRFAKVLITCIKILIDTSRNDKVILLSAPYNLLLVQLLARFLRKETDYNYQLNFEAVSNAIKKSIVLACCRLSPGTLIRCLEEESGHYFESFIIFIRMAQNPWQHMAVVASGHKLPFVNVVNFLYLLHSQQRVLVDWEYFINVADHINMSTGETEWKNFLKAIMSVVYELDWFLEEEILVKVYRLLSSHRFENVGSHRSQMMWCNALPRSVLPNELDGCLDLYFKLLVLYVSSYMEPGKEASLVEKLTPIGDIRTSTLALLKNRANVLLVMTMLFKRDFTTHFKNIMKAMFSFKSPQSTNMSMELLLVFSRCYLNVFSRLPFGLIKGCLLKVVDAFNTNLGDVSAAAESFRTFVDFIERLASNSEVVTTRLSQYIDICLIILKLRTFSGIPQLMQIPSRVIGIIQVLMTKIVLPLDKEIEHKFKIEVITSLKSILLAPEIKPDYIKTCCIQCWVNVYAFMGVDVDALVHLEWAYFGTESVRTEYELIFYSSLMQYYEPKMLSSIQNHLLSLLLQNIPKVSNSSFFHFFRMVAKQPTLRDFVVFRNGKDFFNVTDYEFKQHKQQITIKILAKIVIEMREKTKEVKFRVHLKDFIQCLAKEYWAQKDIKKSSFNYKAYAAHIVQYLNTVAKKDVSGISEFNALRHELCVADTVAPLNERFESLSSIDEFVIIAETEYIISLIGNKVADFEAELLESISSLSGLSNDHKVSSGLFPVVLIVSLHCSEVLNDESHWVHLAYWLTVLLKQIDMKGCLGKSDIWSLIRLLVQLSNLKSYRSDDFSLYVDHATGSVCSVLQKVHLALIGFEDRIEFINALPVSLNLGLDWSESTVTSSHSARISNYELDVQFSKLFNDHKEILRRHIGSSSVSTLDETYRRSMSLALRCDLHPDPAINDDATSFD